MQVEEKSAEALKREYQVTIAATEIAEKIEARLKELGASVNLPGFRPGKVPLAILKQRFGSNVMGEVLEGAVNDSSNQAISERGLRPALQPKIEIESFKEGEDLVYSMAVELLPQIEPGDFSTITLERIKVEVPDADVDRALADLAERHRHTEPLAEPRPAAAGDVVVLDFAGSVDGEEKPGMRASDHHLELGANQFIPGFDEQLIGAAGGEHRQVKVTFPEDYGNAKLAGKEAVFEVDVKEVRQPVPMAVDDHLAKHVGMEDLAALRTAVRKSIESEYQELARSRLKREVLDKLDEMHRFDVPTGMVDQEFDIIWRQIEHDRAHDRLDPEDAGKSEDELKAEYRSIAERRVRLGLLLSEVGQRNNIKVGEEEVGRSVAAEARRYPGKEQKVVEFYRKNPMALANLRAPIFENKVVDFIVELAKSNERSLTPQELVKEMSEEAATAGGPEMPPNAAAGTDDAATATKPLAGSALAAD
jgi:trigger factor